MPKHHIRGGNMMKQQYKYGIMFFLILFLTCVVLVACNNDKGEEEKPNEPTEQKKDKPKKKDVKPKAGGTVVGGMRAAPSGMFNPIFYEETYEANIIDFVYEGLVVQDENLKFMPHLAKEWETNDDQTEITFKLVEGVKWHDGEFFTAHDVVFTYKSMADPDYISSGGIRIDYVEPLKGYEAYNSGNTKEFKGVVAEDDHTVTFHFEKPNVNPLYTASFPIIPKHIFKDVEVSEMPKHPGSLEPEELIGTGPFQFTNMVEREEYVLEKFTDYWQDEPYLDKIIWKISDQADMTELLQTGKIDFISEPNGIAPVDYETVKSFPNIKIIEQPDFGYQLLGFKHNHRTTEDVGNGLLEPDNWKPNDKLANPKVRQAIAYAINRQELIGEGPNEGLLNGRGEIIHSPIAMQMWAYDDKATVDYDFNPKKAKEMLDELGYKEESDGFRTDPDGNEWILNMDYPTGNELREQIAPLVKEMLENVGIKINLRKPKEMSVYVEDLTNDDSDWDLYLLGLNLRTTDPDPSGFWSTRAPYNFSRWNNPESDKLIKKALKTPEAFELDFRKEIYEEWQKLFSKDLPALLLFAENKLWAYNERIQNITPLPRTMFRDSHLWWVTDAEE